MKFLADVVAPTTRSHIASQDITYVAAQPRIVPFTNEQSGIISLHEAIHEWQYTVGTALIIGI